MSVESLDRLLAVPAPDFEAVRERLVERFRRDRTEVDIASYRAKMSVPATTAAPDLRGGNLYHAELRRIPPMDRDEEFRMARRHEFLRARVQAELERFGLGKAEAAAAAARARSDVLAMVDSHRARRRADRALLDACLQQLEQLRNLYVEGSLHLVLSTVNRYRGLGVDAADLIQEGNASLFQAIEGFDWRRDVRFRTYAQYWVHQAVLKLLYNSSRTVRIPIWVQKLLGKIRRQQNLLRREGREATYEEIGQQLGVPAERVAWVLGTKRYAVSLDAELAGEDGSTLAQLLPDENLVPVPEMVPEGDLRTSLDDALADLPPRERSILHRRFGLDGTEPETLGEIAADMGITAERVRQLQNAAITRLKRPAKLRRLEAFVESA